MTDVVQRLWGFCNTLRHDGIDYGDYIEQITYLLFLKMADERGVTLPEGCDWQTLLRAAGTELADRYTDTLRTLSRQPGMLGAIFAEAQSRFNNPVNLKRLLALIDETEWTALDVDVKAQAYEGLLEKAASEGKKGAGQYFTPRVLIQSIVRVMQPDPREAPDFTVADPACGTGGFLVAAYEWLRDTTGGALERELARRVRERTYYGTELVARPRRLALMNLFLHNLTAHIERRDAIYEPHTGEHYSVVLTNPPFGTKGANQAPGREDFTIETSNKQLNFLQHVVTILKPGGRAAVVLPDNCLFAEQAGRVFELVMEDCAVHTILRLPNGTFTPYSQGVKANVVFLRKGPRTERTWIYDARTNVPGITKTDRPLSRAHFAGFEAAYGADPNGGAPRGESERFRVFDSDEIRARGWNLDITWLRDELHEDAAELPEPSELAAEAITELEAAVDELQEILRLLGDAEAELVEAAG
ncbi:MAG TPA: class I SAM-dependent DNA methyltransferase [Dehalococcoidia bacterium]|nr:class I SAM-dependent DNA methyltransferase [Dehalococcoidia bacterium]